MAVTRFVEPGTSEWIFMWDALADLPVNHGLGDRWGAHHQGESWQYMGTSLHDGQECHCFRHRNHPNTKVRELRWIPVEPEANPPTESA